MVSVKGLLLVALLASGAPAFAQDVAVKLEPMHTLRKGVEAVPAILTPMTPEVARVNASTARQNRAMVAQFGDCDISYRQWTRATGQKGGARQGDLQRIVNVTMLGPRWVSFVVSDYTFCGGAHPSTDTYALVYDLTTGRPVNWTQMLRTATATSDLTAADDGTRVGLVQSAKLRAMFVAGVDAECKDALREETSGFVIWPDMKAGTLVVAMPEIPHALALCGEAQTLTAAQVRALGLRDEMVVALGMGSAGK